MHNLFISSGQKIMIRFPKDYDPLLSLDELVITSSVLQGALKYTLTRRDLLIYGFYTMLALSTTIDIDIWGVINPNRINNQRTDYFGIGILNNNTNGNDNTTLLQGTFTIDGIIPLLAPGNYYI